MNISAALRSVLVADPAVASLVSTYRGEPAVFTSRPVPRDAARPFVVCYGGADEHADEIGGRLGIDAQREILVVVDNTGSALPLSDLAGAVRKALHRQAVTIPGARVAIRPYCLGSRDAPTDETLAGVLMTFRTVAMEE